MFCFENLLTQKVHQKFLKLRFITYGKKYFEAVNFKKKVNKNYVAVYTALFKFFLPKISISKLMEATETYIANI